MPLIVVSTKIDSIVCCLSFCLYFVLLAAKDVVRAIFMWDIMVKVEHYVDRPDTDFLGNQNISAILNLEFLALIVAFFFLSFFFFA